MPTINAQIRKKAFKAAHALDDIEQQLRYICAPILSTEDNEIEPNTGLIVNVNKCTRLDRRFDLYVEIEGYGEPEVSGRDIEIITAKIKAELTELEPKIRFGGWVKIGAEKRWFSSHMQTPSVAEIELERAKLTMTIEQLLPGAVPEVAQVRAKLKRYGINTLGDLLGKTTAELAEIPMFGIMSQFRVEKALSKLGIELDPV